MKFIVRMKGGYALHFHHNVTGRCYSAVADDEATIFMEVDSAVTTAIYHGLRVGTFEVEPLAEEVAHAAHQ